MNVQKAKQTRYFKNALLIAAAFGVCAFEVVSKDFAQEFKDKPMNDLKVYAKNYDAKKKTGQIIESFHADSIGFGPKNIIYTPIGNVSCSTVERWEVSTALFHGDSTIFMSIEKLKHMTENADFKTVKTIQQTYKDAKLNYPYL